MWAKGIMFGSCYKQNDDKSAVTVYTDNIRAILFIAMFFIIPIGMLFIPKITPYFKLYLFIFSSLFAIIFINLFYKYIEKTPLFIIR